MSLQLKEILPGIYHIKFPSQYELTSTFMRLQEFYESSFEEIRNQYFTVEQYMDRYAQEFGNFTYFSDWNGFNVPGDVIGRFFRKFSNIKSRHTYQYLTIKEKRLLKLVLSLIQSDTNFYLIATHDDQSLQHEIAHGFWYLNDKYQKAMMKLVSKYEHANEFKALLQKEGYGDNVLDDEIHAYLVDSPKSYLKKKFKFKQTWSIPTGFKKVFDKHKKEQEKIIKEKQSCF